MSAATTMQSITRDLAIVNGHDQLSLSFAALGSALHTTPTDVQSRYEEIKRKREGEDANKRTKAMPTSVWQVTTTIVGRKDHRLGEPDDKADVHLFDSRHEAEAFVALLSEELIKQDNGWLEVNERDQLKFIKTNGRLTTIETEWYHYESEIKQVPILTDAESVVQQSLDALSWRD